MCACIRFVSWHTILQQVCNREHGLQFENSARATDTLSHALEVLDIQGSAAAMLLHLLWSVTGPELLVLCLSLPCHRSLTLLCWEVPLRRAQPGMLEPASLLFLATSAASWDATALSTFSSKRLMLMLTRSSLQREAALLRHSTVTRRISIQAV